MKDGLTLITIILLLCLFIFIWLSLHISKKIKMNKAIEIKEGMYDTEAFDLIGKFYDKKLTQQGEDIYYWYLPKSNGIKSVELRIRNHRVSQIITRN